MSLKTDEVIVIAAGAGLLLFWLILASTLSKFRSPSVSLLILLILGSLGAVFYGIHEDKSNLWWIISTVVIGLCLIGVVYLVSRRINYTAADALVDSIREGIIVPEKIAKEYLNLTLRGKKRFSNKMYHLRKSTSVEVTPDIGSQPDIRYFYGEPKYDAESGTVMFLDGDDLISIKY